MKNITIAIDDETYDLAAVRAAEANISLSSLFSSLVREIGKPKTVSREEFERLRQREIHLREQISGFSAGDNLPCDELYRRR